MKNFKKVISYLLCFMMFLSVLPAAVSGEWEDNINLMAVNEVTPEDDSDPETGVSSFFDFNDYGPYTLNEAPGSPPEGRVTGNDGISVGAYGDESNPNIMVQQDGQWGMRKGNYMYIHITNPVLKSASRVKVEIEYWRTGNNNSIGLQ